VRLHFFLCFSFLQGKAYIGTTKPKFFDFKTHRISGTLEVLRKLVTGQWDENFQVVPPGKEIEMWDICNEPYDYL
jgi:hypothetical protein